jgi:DNA polymerase-1
MSAPKTKKASDPAGPKILILIDAHAIIHRAFHAIPPLVSPHGEPTGALYGLASFLIKTVRELKPDYVAACFDRPEPTFRHQEFKAYKAKRQKAPDELIAQIKRSRDVVKAFGIPCFEFAGFEADDIIATLVEKLSKTKGLKTYIVTGDRDTLQLIDNDKVVVYVPGKGIAESLIYDEAGVKEKFGISPEQVPDYKGIVGDQSDNIPGVKGVGEKGAVRVLSEFKTLEDFFTHVTEKKIEKLPKGDQSLYKKILADKDAALFSKYLATVRRDAPVAESLGDLVYAGIAKETLEPVFRHFGFESLLGRIGASASPARTQKPAADNPPVPHPTDADFQESTRTERSSLTPSMRAESIITPQCDEAGALVGILVEAGESKKVIGAESIASQAQDLFGGTRRIVGFDLKPLVGWARARGVSFSDAIFDIKIALWMTGSDMSTKKLASLREQQSVHELYARAEKKLAENSFQNLFDTVEMPLVPVLADMERIGIKIDTDHLISLGQRAGVELDALEHTIYAEAKGEFNINSPKQLSEVLFTRLGLAPKGLKKTPGGAISTDAETLERLAPLHPVVPHILKYRELFKLKSTYIDALPSHADREGRIHSMFDQTGTVTGRLSSERPNLQNIPAQNNEYAMEIRKAFVAAKGFTIVSFDYSQIELRVMASLSKDETMIAAFRDGKDIHTITASQVFGVPLDKVDPHMRRSAKTLNFGIIYGMGADAFAKTSGRTREEAKAFIKKYFANFPGVQKFHEDTIEFGRAHGYVANQLGRRRWLPDLASGHPKYRAAAERMAINFPLQSLDADIIKMAMITMAKRFSESGEWGKDVRMILQVHDQLLFEVRNDILEARAREIKRIMETAYTLSVPIIADVHAGPNWGSLHRLIEK